jgi:hypothetical protein
MIMGMWPMHGPHPHDHKLLPLAEGAAASNTLAYVKYFFDSVN